MDDATITLRPAALTDWPTLKHWDEQPHVLNADPNDDWNWEVELTRNPAWRAQLIAELNGRPVGIVQIIDPLLEETHYWGNVQPNQRAIDIWIGEADDLGKGYGTIIMKLAIERCFQEPSVTQILIDPLKSNTRAHQFYERLGFAFVEQRMFNEDDCYVYKLTRHRWHRLKK
jgi:aminoglycoside 6'-N-acetyltransferase